MNVDTTKYILLTPDIEAVPTKKKSRYKRALVHHHYTRATSEPPHLNDMPRTKLRRHGKELVIFKLGGGRDSLKDPYQN